MKRFRYLPVFVILVFFSGCVTDDVILEDPSFDRAVDIAAPVFNAHFEAIDLVDRIGEDDYIYVDENGLINGAIDSAFTVEYDDVITVDDFFYNTSYDLSSYLKASDLTYHFTDTIESELETDKRLDSVVVNTGILELKVTTPEGYTGTWTITFPGIVTSDGDTISFTGSFNGEEQQSIINLDNNTIEFFQNDNGVSSVRMITSIDVSVDEIPADSEFSIWVAVKNIDPYAIFGYFGTETLNVVTDEITFDFFDDDNFSDLLTFKDVNFSLVTTNRFGVPLAIVLDTVVFSNDSTGEELYLQIPDDNTLFLGSADYDAENDSVYSVSDSLVLNGENSNIVDAVNMGPDKVYYSVSGISNPEQDSLQNFIINDGNNDFFAEAKINIPFWFRTDKYERTDTIDFDFREIIDDSVTIDRIQEINLYFDFENGFPFSIYSQAYVVDENMTVLDSLFDAEQQIWKSPPIDAGDKATGTEHTEITVNMDNEQVEKFYYGKALYIILESRVYTGDTDNPEFVKLYSDYTIDIHMSFDMKSNN
ncbi:MAG: hypothetical protein GXO47_11065 [Chlorobi bacterium]|nr:hypothetical protein [Chlorobiota bacterium]